MANGDANGEGISGWLDTPWYKDRLGWGVVTVDVLLTVVLMVITIGFIPDELAELPPFVNGEIPAWVYVFALLGAMGYVFTTLTDDFERTTGDMIQYNFRLPAALVLGPGIFVLADLILGEAADSAALVAGLVFLSGLYVNLAYVRLGLLAERLLPGDEDEDENAEREANSEEDEEE